MSPTILEDKGSVIENWFSTGWAILFSIIAPSIFVFKIIAPTKSFQRTLSLALKLSCGVTNLGMDTSMLTGS